MKSREVRLAARPVGMPKQSDFALAERELPEPADGEVLVRNIYMSVDPYMRGRMNDVKSYAPPYAIGEPMYGGAVGRVEQSRYAGLAPGDYVSNQQGWREAFVAEGLGFTKVDPAAAPISA